MKWPELVERLRHEDHVTVAYDQYVAGAMTGAYEPCASFEDFIIVSINAVMENLSEQLSVRFAMLQSGIMVAGGLGDLQIFSTGCTALLGLTEEMDFTDVYENMVLRHRRIHEEDL